MLRLDPVIHFLIEDKTKDINNDTCRIRTYMYVCGFEVIFSIFITLHNKRVFQISY